MSNESWKGGDFVEDPYLGKVKQDGEKFTAPETIVRSVTAARTVYQKLRSNNLKRIYLYREIESLIQGNPPYDPRDLQAAGLQHVANFNDMSARAVMERHCLAYWNLLYNSENLVRFRLRYKGAPEVESYAEIMAENWDFVIRNRWPSFAINQASLVWQLLKFGLSPVIFPDERSPKWRVVETSKFFIPDQAQSDLDMLTTVCVETEFTVQYLWSVYEEFKNGKDGKGSKYTKYMADPTSAIRMGAEERQATGIVEGVPWNVYELGKLLTMIANSGFKDAVLPDDTFELERKIYSGDIAFDRMFNDTVKVVSLFQCEYTGKISQYMFHRHFDHGSFLYFQGNQYEKMSDAMVIFTMNPGEFTLHANRGLGHKIYSLAQASTQLDCTVVDMAKLASSPIIKSPTLGTKDADQIRFYPGVMTNIGSNEFVQNNLGANMQGVIGAAQFLKGQMQYNLTYSGSDPAQPDPDTGSQSPAQTKLAAYREHSVYKNYVQHFYGTFDKIYQNMHNRIMRAEDGDPDFDIADEWRNMCIEDGVPAQVLTLTKDEKEKPGLPRRMNIFATRAAGAGSQMAHLMGLQELQNIASTFGPREAQAYKKSYISATVGPEYIEEYTQDDNDVDEKAGGASVAGLENAIMQAGKSPIFSTDNEQRSHYGVHMALAQQIIHQVEQQQMDVIQADSVMNVLVPHLTDHYRALASNIFTASFAAQQKEVFGQVTKWAALNRKNAEKAVKENLKKQQDQAAATQSAMTDEQIKTMQAVNDEKRKNLKQSEQIQRSGQAQTAKEAALNKKVDGELIIKAKEAVGKNAVKLFEAQGKHHIDAQSQGINPIDNSLDLNNTATQDAASNPSDYLSKMNGQTPAPADIEPGGESL